MEEWNFNEEGSSQKWKVWIQCIGVRRIRLSGVKGGNLLSYNFKREHKLGIPNKRKPKVLRRLKRILHSQVKSNFTINDICINNFVYLKSLKIIIKKI